MKTSILVSFTDKNLVLLFHYLMIFFLILGFYACSKTGIKSTPPQTPPKESENIKETGSAVSATSLSPDKTVLKSESLVSQKEPS